MVDLRQLSDNHKETRLHVCKKLKHSLTKYNQFFVRIMIYNKTSIHYDEPNPHNKEKN